MTDVSPSKCQIEKAEVESFSGKKTDITALITGFSINQSIDSVSYKGQLYVYDSVGFAENFPLRGEESILLEIVSHDLNTRIRLRTQVHKVSDVTPSPNNDAVSYTIHFISKLSFEAGLKRITKSYPDQSVSDIVKKVFEQHYGTLQNFEITNDIQRKEFIPYGTNRYTIKKSLKRACYIQPTEGIMKLIIPNMLPSQAMTFLAKKAHSKDSPSSSFRFFETLSTFYFVTDEFLIQRGIKSPGKTIDLIYGPYTTLDPNDVELHTKTIEAFTNPSRIDTGADILSGAYSNRILEIDFIRRTAKEKVFDYSNKRVYTAMKGGTALEADDVHTADFIENTFLPDNSRRFLVFRDYELPGRPEGHVRSDQNVSEILSNRLSYSHHLSKTMVGAVIKGRLDIEPGDVVNVDAKKFNLHDKVENNEQLSGNYLVHSTNHDVNENILTTTLKLIKYQWS